MFQIFIQFSPSSNPCGWMPWGSTLGNVDEVDTELSYTDLGTHGRLRKVRDLTTGQEWDRNEWFLERIVDSQ